MTSVLAADNRHVILSEVDHLGVIVSNWTGPPASPHFTSFAHTLHTSLCTPQHVLHELNRTARREWTVKIRTDDKRNKQLICGATGPHSKPNLHYVASLFCFGRFFLLLLFAQRSTVSDVAFATFRFLTGTTNRIRHSCEFHSYRSSSSFSSPSSSPFLAF